MGGPRASSSRRDLGVNPNPLRGCLYWVVPFPVSLERSGVPHSSCRSMPGIGLANDVLVIPASTTLEGGPYPRAPPEGDR